VQSGRSVGQARLRAGRVGRPNVVWKTAGSRSSSLKTAAAPGGDVWREVLQATRHSSGAYGFRVWNPPILDDDEPNYIEWSSDHPVFAADILTEGLRDRGIIEASLSKQQKHYCLICQRSTNVFSRIPFARCTRARRFPSRVDWPALIPLFWIVHTTTASVAS